MTDIGINNNRFVWICLKNNITITMFAVCKQIVLNVIFVEKHSPATLHYVNVDMFR